MTIRTLIVDDEPRARKGIKFWLQEYPDIQIAGECSSGQEAVKSINKLSPDLVFLDIQMPEMNGFEVLQHMNPAQVPVVVFVTAFDQYAIKAFEFHAIDYLLKPIDEDRFREALQHVIAEVNRRSLQMYSEKLKAMTSDYFKLLNIDLRSAEPEVPKREKAFLHRLMIKTVNQIVVVPLDEVLWIESARDLVYIHTAAKKYIHRETMTVLENELDPKTFVRIHRSIIVNISRVKKLHPVSHGDFLIELEGDVKLRLSRMYRAHFQEALEKR
ncbi:MAG: DNA-binding response regulator [Ignavibacteriae bacterium]|nr:MAG: DNA-binding response regulator [Ignavibacteriota bacterium]